MIHNLKPYPAYKPSGVEWLGEVPAHWEISPLKYQATCSSGDQITTDRVVSEPLPDQPNRVPVIGGNGRMGYCRKSNILSPVLAVGRVGALCGNVHVVLPPTWITDNALILRADQTTIELRYLADVLRLLNLNELANKSAQPLITGTQIRDQRLPLPPLPEQAAIVRYLDHVDRRIRRYIRAKQKLIKLLEEQKQAIIHQAVTGQIDVRTGQPYPAYKPSGVEWLGDVPAHWEVRRVKQVSRVQGGFAFSSDTFGDEGVPVVRMNNIHRGVLCLDDVVRVPGHQCKDAFALKEGDIVYGLSGSIGATGSLGNYAVVRRTDLPAQLNQRVARLQPMMDQLVDSFFVRSLQTKTFYEQVLSHTSGTAQFNVSTKDIGSVAIALPPVDEQQRIAQHLSSTAANINIATTRANREIDLLHEYRTRLIADVVTGKLDVREVAAKLPEVDPLAAEDALNDTIHTDAV